MLRYEYLNYAAFTTAKQHRPGVNQAECLACHKPLDKVSNTFTLDQLAAVVGKNKSVRIRETLDLARLSA